jgi:hypothetical protein
MPVVVAKREQQLNQVHKITFLPIVLYSLQVDLCNTKICIPFSTHGWDHYLKRPYPPTSLLPYGPFLFSSPLHKTHRDTVHFKPLLKIVNIKRISHALHFAFNCRRMKSMCYTVIHLFTIPRE